MLISLKIDTNKISCSSNFINFILTSNTLLQYIIIKPITLDYSIFLSLIGFFSSILAKNVVQKLIQKTGSKSIFIYLLASIC